MGLDGEAFTKITTAPKEDQVWPKVGSMDHSLMSRHTGKEEYARNICKFTQNLLTDWKYVAILKIYMAKLVDLFFIG